MFRMKHREAACEYRRSRGLYALLHALDFTLDEAAPIIARWAEIDRRIALIEPLRSSNLNCPPKRPILHPDAAIGEPCRSPHRLAREP